MTELSSEFTEAAPAAPASDAAPTDGASLHDIQLNTARDLLSKLGGSGDDQKVPDGADGAGNADEPEKGDRARGPDGKFAAKPEDQPDGGSEKAADDKPLDPERPAPGYVDKAVKDHWSALPPDVQKAVADRTLKDRQTISNLGNQLKSYEPFGNVVRQHNDYFRSAGLHPAQVVDNLIQWDSYMKGDVPTGLAKLGASYGMDARGAQALIGHLVNAYGLDPSLRDYAGGQGQPSTMPAEVQSRIDRLEQIITKQNEQLRGVQDRVVGREQAAWNAEYTNTVGTIEQFANDNPEFDRLGREINRQAAILLTDDPSISPDRLLKEAYERARYVDPDSRARLVAQQAAADRAKDNEAAKKQQAAAHTANARRVTASNVRGQPPVSQPVANVRDAQNEVLRKFGMA